MSSLWDGSKPSAVRPTNLPHPMGDYEAYPLICQLLFGVGLADGRGWEQLPRNMTLFTEGDDLKVVFGCGDAHSKLYTTVGGIDGLMDQIEKNLESNRFSWRCPKSQQNRR